MLITELLERAHRELDAMFEDVDVAVSQGKHRLAREQFRRLSIRLIATMRAEHATVYPRLAFVAGLADEVSEAAREHDRIERAINEIRLAGLAPMDWRDRVGELRNTVADHARAEQWVLFPIATLALTSADLKSLADAFLAYEPIAASVAGPSITYEASAA
ncbi:MAG: hemerythrin domain-containing protein [Kofleriaceae bacterium]